MCYRDRVLAAVVCCAGLVALVGLTGCEDKEARNAAAEATKKLDEVRAELAVVRAQNTQLLEALKTIPEKLSSQVNDRISASLDQVSSANKELLNKLSTDAEKTRSDATEIVKTARSDFDKELLNLKTALAGDIQTIRKKNEDDLADIKKHVENQLRDLYPYAYQPRRESKAPPEPDAK
ncbi:MAG: hypothetical protein NTW87_13040 [Planctomycetota bacterium]|nr:hypothetical protein [Planctomycetota bacterium]